MAKETGVKVGKPRNHRKIMVTVQSIFGLEGVPTLFDETEGMMAAVRLIDGAPHIWPKDSELKRLINVINELSTTLVMAQTERRQLEAKVSVREEEIGGLEEMLHNQFTRMGELVGKVGKVLLNHTDEEGANVIVKMVKDAASEPLGPKMPLKDSEYTDLEDPL